MNAVEELLAKKQAAQAEAERADKMLLEAKAKERQNIIEQIRGLMSANDITSEDLKKRAKRGTHPTKGTKLPVRYSDGTNKWSGRGLKPKWMGERPKEEFKV